MLLIEESIEMNVVNKIIDETYILEVRPFMCQYPGENQQSKIIHLDLLTVYQKWTP